MTEVYVDTFTRDRKVGEHQRVFLVAPGFAVKCPGPVVIEPGQAFVCDPDIGYWLVEQHGKIELFYRSHVSYGDFFLRFSDLNAALLYKLTWGGK